MRYGRLGPGHDLADPVRHLGALGYPVVDTLTLNSILAGVGPRIVSSHHFYRTAVARAFLFDHHYTILRLFARTRARQTYH